MKLWELYPISDFSRFTYDCYHGFVIRAKNEKEAREMAANAGVDENDYEYSYISFPYKILKYSPWLDQNVTVCKPLTVKGESEIIIGDFHDG